MWKFPGGRISERSRTGSGRRGSVLRQRLEGLEDRMMLDGAGVSAAVATQTAIQLSAATVVHGQPFTITAAVTAAAPGAITPAGRVTFYDGTRQLSTVRLDGAGDASLTIGMLPAGPHAITAAYQGDTVDQPSTSAAATETVTPAATMTTIAASTGSVVAGQPVTLTAMVMAEAPGTGMPCGRVAFYDGTRFLGGVAAGDETTGPASLTFTPTRAGTHQITAVYRGAVNFTGSTSAVVMETVSPAAATHFRVKLPACRDAGTALTAVVTALDAYNNVATGYVGMVHFSSPTDPAATFAADSAFTAADQGVHAFTGAVVFGTRGRQTLTVTDANHGAVAGSRTVMVTR